MVIWSNLKYMSSPSLFEYNGQEDFEALKALSQFLGGTAFDQSGTLVWPFPSVTKLDQSQPVVAKTLSTCFDERAQAIWASVTGRIMVLCGGDIDSVNVIAALLKYAASPADLVVHYTSASVRRYPKLFNEILPALGVETVDRTGLELVGESTLPYCDGRSGDDFQASYRAMNEIRVKPELREGTVDALARSIAERTKARQEHQDIAYQGILRWIANQSFPIETPWQLVLYIHRICFTQGSAWAGILLESDTEKAYNNRIPFYDSVEFSSATRWFAENTNWPEDDERGMKEYAYAVFDDAEWLNEPGIVDIHTVVYPGRLASSWLDETGVAKGYDEFPWNPAAQWALNPDSQPATWVDIRQWREKHKRAPIELTMGIFDADEDANENFKGMIEEFDSLPTLDSENRLTWKRADNSYIAMSKTELQSVYSELKTARAVRGAVLHVKAEQFNFNPPNLGLLSNLAFWMTP